MYYTVFAFFFLLFRFFYIHSFLHVLVQRCMLFFFLFVRLLVFEFLFCSIDGILSPTNTLKTVLTFYYIKNQLFCKIF